MHRFLFTFDIEDFINSNAIYALHTVLGMLKKHKLKAIFFITGHIAEKLSNHPEILELLENHEIGYHSSGHSVRPIIAEFTDIKNYQKAYKISLERETSHISPLTGKIEGKGGIHLLQNLFYPIKIETFRAPGMSWTPPHLEALADLGIKYDFSSNISTSEPYHYKKTTFYPYTFIQHWEGNQHDYQCLLTAVLKRKVTIFDLHPTLYTNKTMWDSIYYKKNPPTLQKVPKKPLKEMQSHFTRFEQLLKRINLLKNAKLIGTDPNLTTPSKDLTMQENDIQKCYQASIKWPKKYFNYNPKYIQAHFYEFFKAACY